MDQCKQFHCTNSFCANKERYVARSKVKYNQRVSYRNTCIQQLLTVLREALPYHLYPFLPCILITKIQDLMASEETTLLSSKGTTGSNRNNDSINTQNAGEVATNISDTVHHKVHCTYTITI